MTKLEGSAEANDKLDGTLRSRSSGHCLGLSTRREHMDDSTTVEWLLTAVGQATRSARFCAVGCLPDVDPGMKVEGLGTIKLPLKRTTAKELVASCQVAPYGKGTQTLVNKNVRNTFELDPKKFRLSGE